IIGTRTPKALSVSTIFGTAAAAASVLTVTRTSSEPARARAIAWLTVDWTSAVSVLVMDWTTIGFVPPTLIPPTFTATDLRRVMSAIRPPEGKFQFYQEARGRWLLFEHFQRDDGENGGLAVATGYLAEHRLLSFQKISRSVQTDLLI